ncbi:chymotrypsin-1 [Lepeophtheirus salmonis]|uniref:chymotrypsin-1 n=1 Tax=Lepeophtheirus salmonis TaxID=72036 RepID=UPI001AE74494|nr:chymotrypsin-like protease CTRL-1 [Lepeophtheirus salmonis]
MINAYIFVILLNYGIVLSLKDVQTTKCMTVNNTKCNFPFEYNGERYEKCILLDGTENSYHCPVKGRGGKPSWEICRVDNCSASLVKDVLFNSKSDIKKKKNIINGEDALPNEFPFIVSIHYLNVPMCGGSIISKRFVLSAAHCTINFEEHEMLQMNHFKLHVGTLDLTNLRPNNSEIARTFYKTSFKHRRAFVNGVGGRPLMYGNTDSSVARDNETENYYLVEDIITNGNFNIEGSSHDFALFKSDKDIVFTDWIHSIGLDKHVLKNNKDPYAGKVAYIAGWGKINQSSISNVLQKTVLSIVGIDECVEIFGEILDFPICAKGKDSSAYVGDSGGPLVIMDGNQFVQIGIISFGQPNAFNSTMPSVFSRVNEEMGWIECVMNGKMEPWSGWQSCDDTCGDIFKKMKFRDCVSNGKNIVKSAARYME